MARRWGEPAVIASPLCVRTVGTYERWDRQGGRGADSTSRSIRAPLATYRGPSSRSLCPVRAQPPFTPGILPLLHHPLADATLLPRRVVFACHAPPSTALSSLITEPPPHYRKCSRGLSRVYPGQAGLPCVESCARSTAEKEHLLSGNRGDRLRDAFTSFRDAFVAFRGVPVL